MRKGIGGATYNGVQPHNKSLHSDGSRITVFQSSSPHQRLPLVSLSFAGGGSRVVEWLKFTLRVWDRTGDAVQCTEFLDRLVIAPGDSVVVEDGPGVPRVRVFSLSIKDFANVDTTQDAGAQTEAFAGAIREGLVRAANWLSRQPPSVFVDLRAAGRITDLFVGGWMTDDQFDLELPPEFLGACGTLGLTLSICTND